MGEKNLRTFKRPKNSSRWRLQRFLGGSPRSSGSRAKEAGGPDMVGFALNELIEMPTTCDELVMNGCNGCYILPWRLIAVKIIEQRLICQPEGKQFKRDHRNQTASQFMKAYICKLMYL